MALTVDLQGSRVLLVGASSGIGRATAIAGARGGGRIAVVGRRAAQLDEVVEAAGGGLTLPADLRQQEDCQRVVAEAIEKLGGLDAVIVPIGYSPLSFLRHADSALWADAYATNVTAPSLVTAAAVEALGGTSTLFLYLSSVSVANPAHGLGVYAASKAALDHSIIGWRLEHPEHRFTRLSVGATTPTDIYRDFSADVLNACMPLWASSGLITKDFMRVEDVGVTIAELTALVLAHPEISIDELTVVPASPPMAADELAEYNSETAGVIPASRASEAG